MKNNKRIGLIASTIISISLILIGLNEVKEISFFHHYYVFYGYELSRQQVNNIIYENEISSALFWATSLIIIILIILAIKKRFLVSKKESAINSNLFYGVFPRIGFYPLLLIGLFLSSFLTYFFTKSQATPQPYPVVLSRPWLFSALEVKGQDYVNSNEAFPIVVKLGLYDNTPEDLKKSEPENKELIEYEATTRLQSGFVAPSSLQDWQPRRSIKVKEVVEWNWILKPDLERYGKQPILVEGLIYDKNNKIIDTPTPILVSINVKTPLGLPSWMGNLISFLGLLFGIPVFSWIVGVIMERYIKKEPLKETKDSDKTTANQLPLATPSTNSKPDSSAIPQETPQVSQEDVKGKPPSKKRSKKDVSND